MGKFAQQKLDADGHIALMLSASEIKNRRKDKFEELLLKKFSHQYGNNPLKIEMFKETLANKKSQVSLIIDDFEDFNIKRTEWQTEFFDYMREMYTSVILLADSSIELEAVAKAKTREMLEGFETYKILQLGHVKRDELIQKWISAGDDESLNDDEVLRLRLDISNKVNTAVGSNFIPTYPFYVLTMVHLIADGSKVSTQRSSYADLYNYFITHALLESGANPENLDFYLTYLAYLAYGLLESGKERISSEELTKAYEAYVEKMAINKSFNAVHRMLVNAKLIKFDGDCYSFSLSYCKYYFMAKYLSENIDDPEIKETIKKVTNRLYRNENANIVIFLVHHSKSSAIITAIIKQAKQQFIGVAPQTLSGSDMKNVNSLIQEEIKFALKEISPEESRKKELAQQDRYERQNGDEKDQADILDIFGQVNLAFRTIDVLGQIANNYYGSLDAKSKADIMTELYALGLRGLRAFLDSFDNYIDALRQYFDERIEEKGLKSEIAKSNEIDKIIYGFVQLISFAFLKRISDSISSKNLTPTLNQVVSEQNSPAAGIVDIAARLNFPNELSKNKRKVEVLHKQLDKNYLPSDLLKMFVLQHMYKFNISYQDKQSICDQLGIDYDSARKRLS